MEIPLKRCRLKKLRREKQLPTKSHKLAFETQVESTFLNKFYLFKFSGTQIGINKIPFLCEGKIFSFGTVRIKHNDQAPFLKIRTQFDVNTIETRII